MLLLQPAERAEEISHELCLRTPDGAVAEHLFAGRLSHVSGLEADPDSVHVARRGGTKTRLLTSGHHEEKVWLAPPSAEVV